MFIINNRIWFFALTAFVVLLALISLFTYGLKMSIDFTGGTLVQVTYPGGRPAVDALSQNLNSAGIKDFSIREANTNDYIVRAPALTTSERSALPQTLTIDGASSTIDTVTEIGPTIGQELRNKAIASISFVLLCILLFIAFAFRKVSKPVSSWMYGLTAIFALIVNVIITLGFFAALGNFTGALVDSLFVTAILTVLGFTVHDTIVVFDRTRENLRVNHDRGRKEPFAETAGHSISQTLVRSINTSVSVLISLGALYFVGPEATRDFSLTLLVGIIAGTYSSICLSTPLLVAIEKYRAAKK